MNNLFKDQLTKLDYTVSTDLCSIMKRNNSDKSGTHNYTVVYDLMFKHLRSTSINIMECGIGSTNSTYSCNMGPNGTPGASLFGWADYFTKASIYGCDIDESIIISHDRITTFGCDQTNPKIIKEMWNKLPQEFDIIIDDGWHVFEANKCFFENSFYKLKSGGIYVIEDIFSGNGSLYKTYLKNQGIKNNFVIQLPFRSVLDNCMAIIFKE